MSIYSHIFDQFQRYNTVKRIVESLPVDQDIKVLEVGANAHFNLSEYLPNAQITFSDLNPSSEEREDFVQADASDLPFESNEFDYVVCLDVLEHVPESIRHAVITECIRVSRKAFIMCCPINNQGRTNIAERSVSAVFKQFHHREHPWLKEHFDEGVPNLHEINQLIESLSVPYMQFNCGQLDWWETMMKLHMMETVDTRFSKVCEEAYLHYNRHLYYKDTGHDCYRSFWVIGDEADKVGGIERLLSSPTESDQSFASLLSVLTEVSISLSNNIRKLQGESDQQNEEIARLEELVSIYTQTQTDLLNSTSWRVTAPLRALTYLLRGDLTHFKVAIAHRMPLVHKAFSSSNGGIKRKFRRACQVFKDEGMSAVIRKISTHITTVNGYNGGPIISAEEYRTWIASKKDADNKEAEQIIHELKSQSGPLISIIVPTYNTDELFLKQCIDSVVNQSYSNWELCLADDASTSEHVRDVIAEYCRRDGRIKAVYREENGHISAASNSAISIAEGEWIALLDHDDELHKHALSYVAHVLERNPQTEFVYTDEDKINERGERFDPHFKPEWNPDLFYSQNYISHLSVYKSSIVRKIGGFRIGFEGSQDYDFLLRYSREINAANIVHIPKVLYHWRAIEGSTALEAGQKDYTTQKGIDALQDHFDQQQTDVQVMKGKNANTYRVKWSTADNPLVSLIIPTRNGKDITKQAIDSILNKTSYRNYEIILVDNNSEDEAALEYFAQLDKHDKVTVLKYPHPFNYSAINNFAVRHANGDIVGLVNNDVEVINSDWLTEMVSHAIRPDVGCVGAKLYYSNDTVQHAGIILGIGGVAGHSHKHFPRDSQGYFSRLNLVQNLSAVTAACLLIRKEVFELVGGLNETDLTVAFNDVDFCLRVREQGYRNLWTPYAELYHYESISRGAEDNPEKIARFNKEVDYMKGAWTDLLTSDPSYNVNLTKRHENFSISVE
ncbi:glycosyltransferase [Vibrio rumoiensis]|uniref:Glycosyltransferase n=1 Tax=Vibrio rumoiensis TaxID=76258 RepID=A0ABW7IT15_9VIBR